MSSLNQPILLLLYFALAALGCAAGPPHEFAGPNPEVELREAESRLAAGDAASALKEIESWLAKHPEAPSGQRADAHRSAAHACALLDQPEEGLVHADAGVTLSPDDPWLHYARGVALNTIGEYVAALDAFSRALGIDPRHVKSAQWRGYTYLLIGQPAEAVRDYNTALAIIESSDEESSLAWGASRRELTVVTLRGRADALDALGHHDAAEADRKAAR